MSIRLAHAGAADPLLLSARMGHGRALLRVWRVRSKAGRFRVPTRGWVQAPGVAE